MRIGVENLYSIHTIDSMKKATLVNNIQSGSPLNVFIQVNTSQEDCTCMQCLIYGN